ncbi:hypothetical protein C2S53_006917 [Perilla frutescens var. hirtella]|uniref:Uncharacterized protein n=1 Tax=Perilla frutescens var. hirtella TaxID=608512 RepID=A0AAD4JEW7_PERFH|nr:hypothetical protein C2S53_006917 [Perilla frutescens var. hirtella]
MPTLLHSSLIHLFVYCLLSAQPSLQQNINIPTLSNSTFISRNDDDIIVTKPGCPRKCGNLTVPYPFGIGIASNCSMNPWFDVYCDSSVDPPYMLLSTRDDYRLVDISDSQIRIKNPFFASRCYSSNISSLNLTLDFSATPYSLSDSNTLTQVGCSDLAVFEGFSMQYAAPNMTGQNNFATGCVSFCSNGDLSLNGSCPGNGCCQIPVPKGTVFVNSSITGLEDRWRDQLAKPCSYSFIGERESFSFKAVSDLYQPPMTIVDWLQGVTVALDWRIGAENCSRARSSPDFSCQKNSDCIDADAGVGGYRCACLKGYQGNPYLPPGCLDIDECKSNPCHATGICINSPGDYACGCPEGYDGDGRRNSSGCFLVPMPSSKLSKLSIGLISGMGFVTLFCISILLAKFVRKRENNKQKHKFFKQNGGLLLQRQTSVKEGILGKTRIFTAKELDKATDKFNESRILGQGGQGTVYKGMLSDGQIVAIKKSQLVVDEHKTKHIVEQFINEVVILSQINHRNVVKLLGCCLETKVPLLVYEFVPNGTLFHHIHEDKNTEFPFSWNMRLKIAADVAGAFAYLHSATSLPIFHRDIKSSNILLDEKYVAKVSDFGTSKSVAVDQTHLTTNVNGTFGYIDPEYFRSSQFTEKSDVYSFGVVLVELFTGLKPILPSTQSEDDSRSLVSRFLSSMDENNLDSILDNQVSARDEKEGVVAVARLAQRCLDLNGKNRPYMKEVAMELESVRIAQMGSAAHKKLPEDSSFPKLGSMILSTDDNNYSWTTTSDFPTHSSSDAFPIMLDTP